MNDETQHLNEVSGRDLTMKMVKIINAAIASYEEETKSMLQRNGNGKVIQPIIIDSNENEEYVAKLNNIIKNILHN